MKTVKIEVASDDQIYWEDGETKGDEQSGEAQVFLVAPDGTKTPIRISFDSI